MEQVCSPESACHQKARALECAQSPVPTVRSYIPQADQRQRVVALARPASCGAPAPACQHAILEDGRTQGVLSG